MEALDRIGELIEHERGAYDRWRASLAGVASTARRADGWNLVDVVAHVAAWQRSSAERIAAFSRDGVDPGPPADADTFNDRARAAGRSWDEVHRDADEAIERLLSLVASLTEDHLDADEGLIPFIVRVNGSEHYDEHPPAEFTA